MTQYQTDEPNCRTRGPEENHLGMKYIVLTAGFCKLDEDNATTNSDGENSQNWGISNAIGAGHVLLRANLPTLSRPNEKCLNATLELWLQEPIADTMTLSLHRMLKDWVRDEATWNQAASGDNWDAPGLTAGVDYQLTAEITETVGNLRGSPVISFDLNTWINDVCNDGDDNFGWIIIASGDAGATQVVYGEGASYQQQPRLIVETAYDEVILCDQDTYIDEANPNTNLALDFTMNIGNPSGANNARPGLFKFDLSSVPASAEIVSCNFYLKWQGTSAGTPWLIYPILESWVENGVTWNSRTLAVGWTAIEENIGTYCDTSLEIEWSVTHGSNEYDSVDITSLFKEWHLGVRENYGFVLALQPPTSTAKVVYSGEVADSEPYLDIVYRT